MLNVDKTFNMAQALCTSALEASYVNRLNVDETFNMAQALCTSALAASYVNRLNVFFLINYKKPRHLVDVSADIIF